MSDTQLRLQESPRLDGTCPRCQQPASGADANCSSCLSPHHAECWDAGSRCARCGGTAHFVMMQVPGRVSPSGRRRPPRRRAVVQSRLVAAGLLVAVTACWLFLQV